MVIACRNENIETDSQWLKYAIDACEMADAYSERSNNILVFDARFILGAIHLDRREYRMAEDAFEKAIQAGGVLRPDVLNKNNVSMFRKKYVQCLRELGKNDKADQVEKAVTFP